MTREDLYESIGALSDDIIDGSERQKPPDKRKLVRLCAAAACLCLVITCAAIFKGRQEQPRKDSGITVTEEGVTIPQMKVKLSGDPAADMIAFFIYQGRSYVQYEVLKLGDVTIGEHLGTARGTIDEWTEKDGYVELAGSISGPFYVVEGVDPEFMLCMVYDNGDVWLFINNNGLTLKTGADIFEERLRLSGNYTGIRFETRQSWYYGQDDVYELRDTGAEAVSAFVEALNTGSFMRTEDIPLEEGEGNIYDSLEIYHVYFKLASGIPVHLRLFEGGYVSLKGLLGVCVKVDEGAFNEFISLLEDVDASSPAET
ncbi:MAG: hypothetical protein ACI3VB_06795 [Oscillospiraceae bacterium]